MEQTKQIQNTQTKLQTNVHTYIRTWQLFKQKKKKLRNSNGIERKSYDE